MSTNVASYSYWSSSQSILDKAHAAYKQASPQAQLTGYWVIHPSTLKQLLHAQPLTGFGPNYLLNTVFGRPVHTSPHLQPGEFYFNTEPEPLEWSITPDPVQWSELQWTMTQDPVQWSTTPEPDWLIAMAAEMAVTE